MPDIVVIIPSLNVAETLPRQLAALDAQTDLGFRVVIADNGSEDGTARVAREWPARFEGIEVVDASARRGVASARNIGIRESSEPLILICDGDDRVHERWVESMRRSLASAAAVTGPLRIVRDGELGETVNQTSVPVAMAFRPYMPGCNIGVRREAVDLVGGFDADLSIGQEDVDFGWRLDAVGIEIVHDPGACVDYYQRSTPVQRIRQQYRYGRAYAMLYRKHQDVAPPPARLRTSIRWFWEWCRQFRPRDGLVAFGDPAFHIGRLVQSARLKTPTPL
ncbi:glycosyltransferase family 2 protein [Brachybacterium hainanense]|uniref:Glycosyltransferase family 2 protein n=1 Tax=Brachybacterium hainanense TaxID=1541174 RepID=A0ABV6RCI1_9MICO